MAKKRTILLYGRTRSGKTAQLGELAEHIAKTEGKISRIYTADKGGTDTIQPYIDLGIIELVEQGTTDPLIFFNVACKGMIRDAQGKWVNGINENIGMYAFEGLTSFGDAIINWLAKKAADGVNIGGGGNVDFKVEGDGITIKVGGNNVSHYGVCQSRVTDEVWKSQMLPCSYLVWTASVSKDEDNASSNKVLGPAVAGKALTAEVPRWFNLTFRIDCLPAEGGKPERHLLYLGNHRDQAAGNAIGLGNTRTALDSPKLEYRDTIIEPASIVKALQLIDSGALVAKEAISKRIGADVINKLKALKK
jgi:hypothetical protein